MIIIFLLYTRIYALLSYVPASAFFFVWFISTCADIAVVIHWHYRLYGVLLFLHSKYWPIRIQNRAQEENKQPKLTTELFDMGTFTALLLACSLSQVLSTEEAIEVSSSGVCVIRRLHFVWSCIRFVHQQHTNFSGPFGCAGHERLYQNFRYQGSLRSTLHALQARQLWLKSSSGRSSTWMA